MTTKTFGLDTKEIIEPLRLYFWHVLKYERQRQRSLQHEQQQTAEPHPISLLTIQSRIECT